MNSTRTVLTTAVTAATLAVGLAVAPAASASGPAVAASGTCSANGVWTLKAKHDDSVLQVEGEVDVNHAGRTFSWTITDNGTVVRRGSATTTAPSGSFSVERRIADKAGSDHLVFRATRPGNSCSGAVTV